MSDFKELHTLLTRLLRSRTNNPKISITYTTSGGTYYCHLLDEDGDVICQFAILGNTISAKLDNPFRMVDSMMSHYVRYRLTLFLK